MIMSSIKLFIINGSWATPAAELILSALYYSKMGSGFSFAKIYSEFHRSIRARIDHANVI